MVKFKIETHIESRKKEENLDDFDPDISINITIPQNQPEKIKVGKNYYDNHTLTRLAIVKLSQLGYNCMRICSILKSPRMLTWKWMNYTKFEAKGTRRSKFNDEEKEFLCNKVKGKIVGKEASSSRRLATDFYEKYNKTISHSTINNILNDGLSKPLKVVNTFKLTKTHEDKRLKFAEYIIDNNINTNNIFFTDECRVVLYPKLNKQNNFIRNDKQEREKRWLPEIQKKRENETPKFEKSIMIAGGVCKYGLSNLVFCSGTQNNFSYKQFLLFMKNDMEQIEKDNNLKEKLIFQQDNAACHTSKDSKAAIDILFGENTIEWPPNSPDLSPIENVWAILKEKLSKRNIKNYDDLRENILDIWVKFPVSLCEKLCSKFNDKIKYVKEYKGQRINQELSNKIKKDRKDNNNIFSPSIDDNEWLSVKRDKNYRIVFNDKVVTTIKARFIKKINQQKDNKLKEFSNDNKKLGKYEKSEIKGMNKKEHNKIIDKKKQIISDYYDKKIKELKDMTCKDFILTYLDLEKNKNIEQLMKVNLNNNFELGEASTKISNKIDEIIDKEEDDEKDKIVKSVEEKIDRIIEKGRLSNVRNYIESEPKIKNFFPNEQRKFKREYGTLQNKDSKEEKDIFYILNKLSELNTKIKAYNKENKEKGAVIGINQNEDENEDEEEEEIIEEMQLD